MDRRGSGSTLWKALWPVGRSTAPRQSGGNVADALRAEQIPALEGDYSGTAPWSSQEALRLGNLTGGGGVLG